MTGEQSVRFPSGALYLEGALALPPGAAGAAVICHPHPQYGGTMDNNVVCAAARRLQRTGVATLRFNFRGVGRSEGGDGDLLGECDDARAAIALLRSRAGVARVGLIGYSFGALVALRVGWEAPDVDRLVAVAPPLAVAPIDGSGPCDKPKLLLAGDRDPYCPPAAFDRAVAAMPEPKQFHRLAGADHFFWGYEDEIGEAIARFLLPSPASLAGEGSG